MSSLHASKPEGFKGKIKAENIVNYISFFAHAGLF